MKSVRKFSLWLEFEQWEGADIPLLCDYCNIQIDIEGGPCYALNVWTNQYFEVERQNSLLEGRSYFVPPDLIVPVLDRAVLEEIAADLIHSNQLKDVWLIP